jgi:Holliday junction resolvasome RuvABC endonuclease subunit
MPQMVFIGIDQSLSAPGVAVVDGSGQMLAATTLSVSKSLRGGQRLSWIVSGVQDFLTFWLPPGGDVKGIAIEGPNLNAPNPLTLWALGEISGALRASLFDHFQVEPTVIAPGQLKAFVTGNGAAKKDAMLHAVKTAWGHDFGDDDNRADALGLARFARGIALSQLVELEGTPVFGRRCEADAVYKFLGALAPKTRPSSKARRTPKSL